MTNDATASKELRELAQQIEDLARESRVASMINEQVRSFVDHITLLAKVIELEKALMIRRAP